jgi:hypothetical protein
MFSLTFKIDNSIDDKTKAFFEKFIENNKEYNKDTEFIQSNDILNCIPNGKKAKLILVEKV